MYNKILVPLDGSKLAEEVLPYAKFLASACSCR
jgi:nucleotide-binding universal stress UspA family protein